MDKVDDVDKEKPVEAKAQPGLRSPRLWRFRDSVRAIGVYS